MSLRDRFRGFLPVVIDIETAGFDYNNDAILEIAMVEIKTTDGVLVPGRTFANNILPFEGANLDSEALEFNGVRDPFYPLRAAVSEKESLEYMFSEIKKIIRVHKCNRAILVGHNSWFDLHFLNAAVKRTGIKSPFHSFTSFDTATLGVLMYRHTVLAEMMHRAKIDWNNNEAHSAVYDAEKTAEIFCKIINRFDRLEP